MLHRKNKRKSAKFTKRWFLCFFVKFKKGKVIQIWKFQIILILAIIRRAVIFKLLFCCRYFINVCSQFRANGETWINYCYQRSCCLRCYRILCVYLLWDFWRLGANTVLHWIQWVSFWLTWSRKYYIYYFIIYILFEYYLVFRIG